MDHKSAQDIAVIGISVKMPMADTIEDFWNLIRFGKKGMRDFPENRAEDIQSYIELHEKNVPYEKGSYLENISEFDYKFFGISPREAQLMDPSHRIFLEAAWHCLENGGYGEDKIKGTQTGIYVGYGQDMVYHNMIKALAPEFLSQSATGNCPPMLSGRLSHMLDLKGPNIIVQTVCSSSLTAVHMAVQGLNSGECEMALAGGIQLHILPIREVDINIQSGDGETKSFDDMADGTGSGEGVGIVLLKPLKKAEEDGDFIYAVIKGSCVNHDGSSIGLTAPNPKAQMGVITGAWKKAGIQPETISYIEAHASGTVLGDTVEMQGIKMAFSQYTDQAQFCAIGCIKPNIGHLDAASGIAGFIKAVLCLYYKMLPPLINFRFPNRHIDFLHSPAYINRKLKKWETEGNVRRCGVNSFGFSGSNCHVVLEEYTGTRNHCASDGPYIFTLSAKSEEALCRYIGSVSAFLRTSKPMDISDICYTLNLCRTHYKYRLAFPVFSLKELQEKLNCLDQEKNRNSDSNMLLREKINAHLEQIYREYHLTDHTTRLCYAQNICRYYQWGIEISWKKLYDSEKNNTINLPGYPFSRDKSWIQKIKKNALPSNSTDTGAYIEAAIKEVMGIQAIPMELSFLDIGGNSILAMQIVNRVNHYLGLSLKVTELLQSGSINQFVHSVAGKNLKQKDVGCPVFLKAGNVDYYPLSHSQKRLFALDKLYAKNTAYNMYSIIKMHGNVNPVKIENIFHHIMERHESLRTAFYIVDQEPVSEVQKQGRLEYENYQTNEPIQKLINRFVKPFNLEQGSLFRMMMVQRNICEFYLFIDMHHMISDGLSMNIIIRDFCSLYQNKAIEPVEFQYKDYAVWEQELIKTEFYMKQGVYWRNVFGNIKPKVIAKQAEKRFAGHTIFRTMDKNLVVLCKEYAQQQKMTLFNMLFGVCVLLQYSQCMEAKIMTGTVVSGRRHENLMNTVGFFAKTIAILTEVDIYAKAGDFFRSVQTNIYDAFDNQDYPHEKLACDIYGNISYITSTPFFDTMFIMQDQVRKEICMEDIRLEFIQPVMNTSKFNLLFNVYEWDGGLVIETNYNTCKYEKKEIMALNDCYLRILNRIVVNPDINLKQLMEQETNLWK